MDGRLIEDIKKEYPAEYQRRAVKLLNISLTPLPRIFMTCNTGLPTADNDFV
jgi:hypothetical protein